MHTVHGAVTDFDVFENGQVLETCREVKAYTVFTGARQQLLLGRVRSAIKGHFFQSRYAWRGARVVLQSQKVRTGWRQHKVAERSGPYLTRRADRAYQEAAPIRISYSGGSERTARVERHRT